MFPFDDVIMRWYVFDSRNVVVTGIHPIKYAAAAINTLGPRQNGRQFHDNIFRYISLNENIYTLKVSLKLIPKCPINDIPALD